MRRLILVASLALPALVGVVTFPAAASEPASVLGWAILLALGQLLRVPAPSGNRFNLGLAVAVALPLTMQIPALGQDGVDGAGIAAAYALGLLASWALWPLSREGSSHLAGYVIGRMLGLLVLLGAFLTLRLALRPLAPLLQEAADGWAVLDLIALTGAGLVWYGVESLLRAITGLGSEPGSLRYLWLLALGDWMVMVSLFATGALFGLAWQGIGWWAILVAGLPYAFSHLAFLRSFDTRRTYRQTIGALSRIPEVAGLSPNGHGHRVAELSVAIAQDLGLRPEEVTELEYAALMHDIGRITLNEPSILKAGFTDEDIARWGSEIISEAPYLEHVSTLVREQHHPYRRPGEERDLGLPMASKIIKAASAFDHATDDLGFPVLEALELLHRGAAYDFDPQVVHTLRRVVERTRHQPNLRK
ncbi:MAG: HD domain-containing protein [Actinomycetota bacterium]|nr:HD domain-containing protein [Actinomycetota bacterium]